MHERSFFYEEIYRATRSSVIVAGMGQRLYDSLLFELRDVTKNIRVGLTGEAERTNALEWIEHLVNVTQWYGKCVTVLEGLLAYLDRIYIPQSKTLLHVRCVSKKSARSENTHTNADTLPFRRTAT